MRKFTTSVSGYSKKEVNAFVDDVVKEYEELLNKLKTSDQKVFALEKELERMKNLEGTLNRALMLAEESNQTIRKSAFDESKVIVDDAKKNASRIVNNALIRAEKLENEADNLRRRIFVFKKKFRNMVEENLDELERFDDTI